MRLKKLKNKFVIGVTGPSGAGKTTICSILREHDYFLINADEVSKKILNENLECINKLVDCFGENILVKDKVIDRKKLSDIVFNNDLCLKKLNNITHKYIIEEILKIIKNTNEKVILLDAPLLFESGLNKICKIVVSVISDEYIRQKRCILRDGLSKELVQKRFSHQKSNNFFKENSDYIIFNNSSKEQLYIEVMKLFNFFQEFIDGL